MTGWFEDICERTARDGPLVRLCVIATSGSAPREAGASMIVTHDASEGTIGGGALEFGAIAKARRLISAAAPAPWRREVETYPLGPALGQCCGGSVKILFERYDAEPCAKLLCERMTPPVLAARPLASGAPPLLIANRKELDDAIPLMVRGPVIEMTTGRRPRECVLIGASMSGGAKHARERWWIEPLASDKTPLYLYGAGHVGREIVRVFAGLAFDIVWVDTDAARFPEIIPDHATRLVATSPGHVAAIAPADAFHVVMTYSHPLDLDICHGVLARGRFAWLGLIGSRTKRARFRKRLREAGISDAMLNRMTCPIGADGITGKEPATIAIALAAQVLQISQSRAGAKTNLARIGAGGA